MAAAPTLERPLPQNLEAERSILGAILLDNHALNAAVENLKPEDFERLVQFEPEIVVFGTGTLLRFPHPRLTAALASARIGLEVMDTPAACRTFNILIGEDRKALAAVLVEAG